MKKLAKEEKISSVSAGKASYGEYET